MQITINTKTYDLPNELVVHIKDQQRIIDSLDRDLVRFQNRDGKATIIICETTNTIPFHQDQERLRVIDFGVSDNIYMVERTL